MHNDIQKVDFSVQEIDEINTKIARAISKDYEGGCPLFIGLLKGCLPFMSDMIKKLDIHCNLDYIRVSSYSGIKSTGNVQIKGEVPNVKDRDVIVVDDILDTGRTTKAVKELFESLGAKSVKICVLLDKPEGRKVNIEADYVGGVVPNEFVVGYGLDYNEKYRNLPYIGVLKESVYKN